MSPSRLSVISREEGQSLALIALMLVGLIAFAGIALDVGFIYARRSQLTNAVDSAALAGVTELSNAGGLAAADKKALQFLHTNEVPVSAINNTFSSDADTTTIGAQQYTITVTWPIELFFLKIIGRNETTINASATAAYFPLADIYVSRRVEDGALSTSNQSVFGQNICTQYGDPVSPLNSSWYAEKNGVYNYRILVPADYPSNIVRVELFDPDSANRAQNVHSISHIEAWINSGYPAIEDKICDDDRQGYVCVLDTGEDTLPLKPDQVNKWWFVRIDENRGAGIPPGNGQCGAPNGYNSAFNTLTEYKLFYYALLPSGEIEQRTLARYTGQANDPARDPDKVQGTAFADHQTDLLWISPGGERIYDQPTNPSFPNYNIVPSDCNSPNGGYSVPNSDLDGNGTDDVRCVGQPYSPPGPSRGFEINLDNYSDILTDPSTGNRYIYLDVTALSGASENGFEIWAGPPDYVNTISSNVNVRNVQVLNQPGSHSSKGATVFGIGRLPMNSNESNEVDIPLVYLGPEYAGQTVFVSLFDPDAGAKPPVHFFFDSISYDDYHVTYGAGADPEGRCFAGGSSYTSGCNDRWVDPAFTVKVPDLSPSCDPNNPDPAICTPFLGGRLVARYTGGKNDTYSWDISVTGTPYLVR